MVRQWDGRIVAGAVVALVLLVAVALLLRIRPRLSEEELRQAVVVAIQRESPRAFYVTGAIDVTTTARVSRRTILLPGLLNLGLSTTTVRVQVPARISYGIDTRQLKPSAIQLEGDSLLRVRLPPLHVYSIEPNLAGMAVETDRGWIRPSADQTARLEQRALRQVQDALRAQGEAHLASSVQPRVNTAKALETLLTPLLQSLGMREPRLEFELGEGVVARPERKP